MFAERAYIAWLIQVSRLKIEGEKSSSSFSSLGASFIEQIIAAYTFESNFNVIITSSEQITTNRLQ
jgi:hypothetical protein